MSLGFSPGFDHDRTGFCVGEVISADQVPVWGVFRTIDGGVTWVQAEARGLPHAEGDVLGSVIVSPLYPSDRALFVQVGIGIYRSTDQGDSFSLDASMSGAGPQGENLTPFVSESAVVPGLPGAEAHTVFALAAGDSSARIDPPLTLPVPGSPDRDQRFLLPSPTGEEGFLLAVEVDRSQESPRSRTILYSCDALLTCTERLWEFPWAYQTDPGGGVWLSPDFSETKTIFVIQTMVGTQEDVTAWRSDDAGVSFRPWESVDQLVSQVEGFEGAQPRISIAVNDAFPRRMYLRLSYKATLDPSARVSPPAPPTEQIFRSNDSGLTWKRVAFGTSAFQEGANSVSKRRLPWSSSFGSGVGSKQFLLLVDGRLFLLGSANSRDQGVYCSVDEGRHWSRYCPVPASAS